MNPQQLSAGEPNPRKSVPADAKASQNTIEDAYGEGYEFFGEGDEYPPPPPPSPAPTIPHEDKSTQIFTEPPKYIAKHNKIVQDGFGVLKGPDDKPQLIRRYTLKNSNGFKVQVINYGAIVTSIKCPDKVGRIHDVLLGFDNIEGYIQYQKAYHGAIIGRVANRIRNGTFNICREPYELSKNWKNECHLHGGFTGFDQAIWKTSVDKDSGRVVMTYLSKDGEEGYPGDVIASVAYSISEDFDLRIEMRAVSNQITPVNLTSHMYFNLAGHCAGPKPIKDHFLTINADKYLVTTEDLIPTGDVRNVGGTIYDLRTPRQLGLMMQRVPGGGYDTTFCINGKQEDGIRLNARLRHPASGRVLEVFSDQPSLQVYTANALPDPRRAPKATSFAFIEGLPLGAAHVKLTESVAAVIKPLMEEILGEKPAEAPTSRIKDSTAVVGSLLHQMFSAKCKGASGFPEKKKLPKTKEASVAVISPLVDDILDVKPSDSQTSGKKKPSKILSPTGSMEISPIAAPPPSEVSGAGSSTAAELAPCKEDKPSSESSSSTSLSSSTEADQMFGSTSSDITPSEGSEGPLGPEDEEEPQLFTEMRAKDGVLYYRHGAICLETQNYPDAVNHRRFPNSLLRPGEMYSHTCIYRFGLQERQYC